MKLLATIGSLLGGVLSWAFNFYLPIGSFLIMAAALSIIDTGMGVLDSLLVKKIPITSKAFLSKLKTLCVLGILATSALIADPALVAVGLSSYLGAKFIIAWFALYELFSITEHSASFGFIPAKKLLDWLGQRLGISL